MGIPYKLCSKCRQPNDRAPQRYCKKCHAEYMRAWRPKHSKLPPEAKKKANIRSYTNVLIKRGQLIVSMLCSVSGCKNKAENHHTDYNDPRKVGRMCRAHHLQWHRIVDSR
jgi:hypothetical protein